MFAEFDRALDQHDLPGKKHLKHRRYHYYLHCDPTLAESVTCLQPPWQAGIVRKILDGLDHGGGGKSPSGHDSTRHRGTSHSSSDSSSGADDIEDEAGCKQGNRGGRRPTGTESSATTGEGAEAEEAEGGGGKVDVGAAPSSAPRAGSTTPRSGQGWEPARNSGGGGAPFAVEKTTEEPPTASPAATRTCKAAAVTLRHQEGQVTAGAGAAAGMPGIPERFRAGVESRLGETCHAFQTSIRRAVLNYVLLDAAQRDRLGTPGLGLVWLFTGLVESTCPRSFEANGKSTGMEHACCVPPTGRRLFAKIPAVGSRTRRDYLMLRRAVFPSRRWCSSMS